MRVTNISNTGAGLFDCHLTGMLCCCYATRGLFLALVL